MSDPKPFRFLDLFPELRNRIYDYAAHMVVSHGTFRLSHRPGEADSTGKYWGFLGLTQACRQIRSEFRPLLMPQISVLVELEYLSTFIETFLSTALEDARSAPGSIIIQLDDFEGRAHLVRHVDVTQLLRIVSSDSGHPIEIRSQYELPAYSDSNELGLSLLLKQATRNKRTWHKELETGLGQVLFSSFYGFSIEMVMKAQGGVSWIDAWDDEHPAQEVVNRQIKAYLRSLGVEEPNSILDFVFRSKNGRRRRRVEAI